MHQSISWSKVIVVFVVCSAIRLIPPPFRAPNVEPLMATVMPLSKQGGAVLGFFFAVFSMFLFDVITGFVGMWTIVTALTYGLVAFCAPYFFSKISGVRGYVSYAFIATIFFDLVTGVIAGPLMFGQAFSVALLGQIPFTFMHLVGNMTFALTISPILEMWLVGSGVKTTDSPSPVALHS